MATRGLERKQVALQQLAQVRAGRLGREACEGGKLACGQSPTVRKRQQDCGARRITDQRRHGRDVGLATHISYMRETSIAVNRLRWVQQP